MARSAWLTALAMPLVIMGIPCSAPACDLCTVSSAAEARRTADESSAASGYDHSAAAAATPGSDGYHTPSRWRSVSAGVIVLVQDDATPRSGVDRIDSQQDQAIYRQYLATIEAEVMVNYRVDERWGVRAYIPYLDRRYRTYAVDSTQGLAVAGTESGSIRGVGDVEVEATLLAARRVTSQAMSLLTVLAGVKLPTGASGELTQEAAVSSGTSLASQAHADTLGPSTLVHPFDLALGSGSVDAIVGATGYSRWGRAFATARAIADGRTRGRAGFRAGSDLTVAAGAGVYLLERPQANLGVQAYCTGAAVADAHQDGQTVPSSGSTQIFLGPEVSGSWRSRLSGEAGIDLPVHQQVHGQQLVPNYRLHAGLNWNF